MLKFNLLYSIKCEQPFTSHIIGSYVISAVDDVEAQKTADKIIDVIKVGGDIESLIDQVRQEDDDDIRYISDINRFTDFYQVPLDTLEWDNWIGPWSSSETRLINFSKESKQYTVKNTNWWFSVFLSIDSFYVRNLHKSKSER